ncbi:MAG TPA: N-acetylmuramic acid 6-phosphate etherase [Streptosporangiaceae bacterium]|nr:N-acetylmuramic acid 6-phosphate etherase [Streptosporangiaceae bacterium]
MPDCPPTEERNGRTLDLDTLPTRDLLDRLNDEDALVAPAVRRALPALATVVDEAARRIGAGGRVHYVGSGTSGRLAVLDAAELRPTFGLAPGVVVAHLAGGDRALLQAVEGAEDDRAAGAAATATAGAGDLVVGLSASGAAPFVGAALERARAAGAFTALITANPAAPLAGRADVCVCADTGPEAVAGSTRLKAGTAEKMLLNSFSTALMVRTGRTYSNLMVHVAPANAKLRARQRRLLAQATGAAEDRCATALAAAGGDLRVALVTLLSGADPDVARAALGRSGGVVRAALQDLAP